MSKIELNQGQLQPVVLTDYVCSWSNERGKRRLIPYDLGVRIMEAIADKDGQKKLSGEVQTKCILCGRVHEALRQYCEIEFENNPCPKGHNTWKACVTELNRSSEDSSSYNNVTYEFVVQLHCEDCNNTYSRLVKKFVGTLASIKKIKIGSKGIEIERT